MICIDQIMTETTVYQHTFELISYDITRNSIRSAAASYARYVASSFVSLVDILIQTIVHSVRSCAPQAFRD